MGEERTGTSEPGLRGATLRVARPTDDLEALVRFYRDGLGLETIDHFEDHDGVDGVMLGFPASPYHLEFTRHAGSSAGKAPTRDNLIVFYVPEREIWERVTRRMVAAGHEAVPSANPYWDRVGMTFEDPDGYRVVIQRAAWGM